MRERTLRVVLTVLLAFPGVCLSGCGDDGGPAVLPDAGDGDGGSVESCRDGLQNRDETDVDCGGTCGMTCEPGDGCGADADCTTGTCGSDGTCAALPSCSDGTRNEAETDVDCGGPMCPGCDAGGVCAVDEDCASIICEGGACTAAVCGDGIRNGTDECDGDDIGAPGETATCDVDCTIAACGDGVVNVTAGETCDGDGAGTGGETASCDDDCTPASCGDGVVNAAAGEDCDEGGVETAACNADCTAAVCGDGVLNATAGEVCDDGNAVATDRCDNGCMPTGSDLTISSDATFDTDTGELDGTASTSWDAAASALVVDNFAVASGVTLTVTGREPFRVLAARDIDIAGVIDGNGRDGRDGDCSDFRGTGGAGGPGGGDGGDGGGATGAIDGGPGMGTGGGGAGTGSFGGGGGAGHAAAGQAGQSRRSGTGGAGGVMYDGITVFRGGSGGGGGSADDDGSAGFSAGDDGGGGGGGGGGAILLDALAAVTVGGRIEANGGDGGGALCTGGDGGSGGGGSGGTVVVRGGPGIDAAALAAAIEVAGGAGDTPGANGGDGSHGEVEISGGDCVDGVRNQDETDVDCGGATCGTCADGLGCIADRDCASATCQAELCRPTTCADAAMNGSETDVDCGGPACPGCADGLVCAVDSDCLTRRCRAGACEACVGTCILDAAATITFTGSIDTTDPQWARPFSDCSATSTVNHHYDVFSVTNRTGAAQTLTVTALWAGGDGYLHAFGHPFVATDVSNCVDGDDDFGGTSGSRMTGVPIAAGATLNVIASTFNGGEAIGAYTITVDVE